jgi:hypothetical protein
MESVTALNKFGHSDACRLAGSKEFHRENFSVPTCAIGHLSGRLEWGGND